MNLSDLQPAAGAHKDRKKIGRGPGSGKGVRSTKGNKGDKARGSSKLGFEGGQTPLHRRIPKQRGVGVGLTARGFNTGRYKTHYTIVNLSRLEGFEAGTVITPEFLLEKRVIKEVKDGVKILGVGELTKALTIRAHKFSENAKAAIEAKGGAAELIEG